MVGGDCFNPMGHLSRWDLGANRLSKVISVLEFFSAFLPWVRRKKKKSPQVVTALLGPVFFALLVSSLLRFEFWEYEHPKNLAAEEKWLASAVCAAMTYPERWRTHYLMQNCVTLNTASSKHARVRWSSALSTTLCLAIAPRAGLKARYFHWILSLGGRLTFH